MKKILIIEHETILWDEIAKSLSYEDYKLFQAESGASGIEMAIVLAPDLILCNVLMPDMSGNEVLHKLKKRMPNVSVPFLFFTPLTEKKYFKRKMKLGTDDYSIKPFAVLELSNTVQSWFQLDSTREKLVEDKNRQIETKLKDRLKGLQAEIKAEKSINKRISSQNELLVKQLKERELELMTEVAKMVEIKNITENLKKTIGNELLRNDLPQEYKMTMARLLEQLNEKPSLTKNWALFQLKVNQVYPGFIQAISKEKPDLTQYDLFFVSAMKMGMNTRQIAEILNISDDSVRKSRYRIKKKLGLKKEDNFLGFLHAYIQNA